QKGEGLFNQHLFSGFGAGMRLRNEYLVFSVLQFQLGYYPDAGRYGVSPVSIFERGSNFYRFNQFQTGKPDVAGLDF
ncbi:MAG: hypothetical protein V4543_10140, partial [Bacteroidota bacterium]